MTGERRLDLIGLGQKLAACVLLTAGPALAAVEATPWGPYEFPTPVRSQAEAVAMNAEARVPIVVAIRFLAAAPERTPWINHHLACGTAGQVRADLGSTMVRASTLLAHRLATSLEQGRVAAAQLRAGRLPASVVRYAGPVAVILEPVTISADGEPLSPTAIVEPHLRVFVAASVPRCSNEATGAFGRIGELPVGFLVTAAPSLELGWPSWSPTLLGQRAVMATDDLLAEGFCCGQETAFGLDSLVGLFDHRDYQTKNRLRNALRTLGTSRQRNGAWVSRVRDVFGIPDRFPDDQVRELRFGSGRVAASEFVIWPSGTRLPAAATGPAGLTAALAELVLGLAWHAHVRADLIAPALLESYDPGRKYSFVGWPEEFREIPGAGYDPTVGGGGRVLEVFGVERKLSFVGQPGEIEDNLAFAFAAWQVETAFLEEEGTLPFVGAADAALGKAWQLVAREEAAAVRRRQLQPYRSFYAGSGDPALAGYAAALQTLDQPLVLPGFAGMASLESDAGVPRVRLLRWQGREAILEAGSIEELKAGLIRLYASTYHLEPGREGVPP